MAQQVIVTLTDDIDPDQTADKTVTFALDGKAFEIDLSSENIDRLHEALAVFIEHGRPVKTEKATKPGAKPKADREQTQAVRDWGRAHGFTVSDRGRIPAEVLAAYNAA